jgi:hypothetical protein
MSSAPQLVAQDLQLDCRMVCLAFVQVLVRCDTSTTIVRMCTILLLLLSECELYYYYYCQNVQPAHRDIKKVCPDRYYHTFFL